MSPWSTLGFEPSEPLTGSGPSEQIIVVAGLLLRFRDDLAFGPSGLSGWSFALDGEASSSVAEETSIDGVPTRIVVDSPIPSPSPDRLGVTDIDHVVVMTGSLDRTCAAITETIGEPLRRIRDAGHGVRQGFHKVGSIVLEVVERPDIDPLSPASLWGLVFTVADLDEAVRWLGPDAVGSVRDAVQPGRRIATIRSDVGLGVPLALMSSRA